MDLNDKNLIYVLGFIWADGSLRNNSINIEIKYSDFENIKNIIQNTKYEWKYKTQN